MYNVRPDVVVDIVEYPVIVITCRETTAQVRPRISTEPWHLPTVAIDGDSKDGTSFQQHQHLESASQSCRNPCLLHTKSFEDLHHSTHCRTT